jgi:hypothetical protein
VLTAVCRARVFRRRFGRSPHKAIEEVERPTIGWVQWHNVLRLLGDAPPADAHAW